MRRKPCLQGLLRHVSTNWPWGSWLAPVSCDGARSTSSGAEPSEPRNAAKPWRGVDVDLNFSLDDPSRSRRDGRAIRHRDVKALTPSVEGLIAPSIHLRNGRKKQLSPAMEGFSATFYSYMNADEQTPGAIEEKQSAIKVFVDHLNQGFNQVHDPAFRPTEGQKWRCAVAYQEGSNTTLGDDFTPSADMLLTAIEHIARLNRLPVTPWGVPIGPTDGPRPKKRSQTTSEEVAVADNTAHDLSVLLYSMEAIRYTRLSFVHYKQLLSALRLACRRRDAEALYARMHAGHKGPISYPDLECCRELFDTMSTGPALPDVASMFRLLKYFSEPDHFKHHGIKGRVPFLSYVFSATLRTAAQQENYDTVLQVLAFFREFRHRSENGWEGEVRLFLNTLLSIYPGAPQAGRLDVATEAWHWLNQFHPQALNSLGDGVVFYLLTLCARHEDALGGADLAHKAFAALKDGLKVEEDTAKSFHNSLQSPLAPPLESLYQPSVACYQAYIQVLSRVQDWETAFAIVAEMEQLCKNMPLQERSSVMSPMHGLAPLAEAIGLNAGTVRAAYQALLTRQLREETVTATQMNVILRGMAIGGRDASKSSSSKSNTDVVATLFEEYPVAGLQHNLDSYNAVLEACVPSAQAGKALGVLQYMLSQNRPDLQPSSDTFDLLIRSQLAAQDLVAAGRTVLELRKFKGVRARLSTMLMGQEICHLHDNAFNARIFAAEIEHLQVMGMDGSPPSPASAASSTVPVVDTPTSMPKAAGLLEVPTTPAEVKLEAAR